MRIWVEYLSNDFLKKTRYSALVHYMVNRLLNRTVLVIDGILNPQIQSQLIASLLKYVNTEFYGVDFKIVNTKVFSKKTKRMMIIYPVTRDILLGIDNSSESLRLSFTFDVCS